MVLRPSFVSGAHRPWWAVGSRRSVAISLVVRIHCMRRWLWFLYSRKSSRPVTASSQRWWGWSRWRLRWRWRSPHRTWRTVDRCRLICLWVDVLWQRSAVLVRHAARGLPVLQKLQASLDVDVCGVEVGCALVGVEGIGGLVVAGFILCEG